MEKSDFKFFKTHMIPKLFLLAFVAAVVTVWLGVESAARVEIPKSSVGR